MMQGSPNNQPCVSKKYQECTGCSNTLFASQTGGASKMLCFMYDLWQKEKLCDIIIHTQDGEMYAHKIALAAHSEALAARFADYQTNEVLALDLCEFSCASIYIILYFVYTTELVLEEADLGEIVAAAVELGLTCLIEIAKNHLSRYDSSNVLCYQVVAARAGLWDLESEMYRFICDNFVDVINTGSWEAIGFQRMHDILSDCNIVIRGELDVFTAIVKWIDYKKCQRIAYAPCLMKLVSLDCISPDDLYCHVEPVRFLFDICECKEQLYNAWRYHAMRCSCQPLPCEPARQRRCAGTEFTIGTRSSCQQRGIGCALGNSIQPNRQLPGRVRSKGVMKNDNASMNNNLTYSEYLNTNISRDINFDNNLMAVGGIDLENSEACEPVKGIFSYNQLKKTWNICTPLNESLHHHSAAVVDRELFVFGGIVFNEKTPNDLGKITSNCCVYNLISNRWDNLPKMQKSRAYAGIAVQQENIYLIGGEGIDNENRKKSTLSSVEVFNTRLRSWSKIPDMPGFGRASVGACAFQNKIFVVGGLSYEKSYPLLNEVLVFNIKENDWSLKNPLRTPRCHSQLIVSKNRMYLLGGREYHKNPVKNNLEQISNGEINEYDNERDTWSYIGSLLTPRHDFGCVSLSAKIFIVGGVQCKISGSYACLDTVESFDTRINKIQEEPKLLRPLAGTFCVKSEK